MFNDRIEIKDAAQAMEMVKILANNNYAVFIRTDCAGVYMIEIRSNSDDILFGTYGEIFEENN